MSDVSMKVDLSPVQTFKYSQIPNHDFCFVLLNDENQALHTPFTCKDYLQDIFWSEFTGNVASVWGINWKKGLVNTDKSRFRIALLGGEVTMVERVAFLEEFINYFDNAQGFELTTVHPTDDPKIIVVEFSKDWLVCGPMLSALTSMIRVSGAYTGGDPMEFLNAEYAKYQKDSRSIQPAYSMVDVARLSTNLPKFEKLLTGFTFDHDWSQTKTAGNAHNTGIMGYNVWKEIGK